jgi:toxin FitB
MTALNVVDSSGWIEFFLAGANGPRFRDVIDQHEGLVVPTTALYEVCRVLDRKLPAHEVEQCLDVMRLGRVVSLDQGIAISAARFAAHHKLAFADAAMYATAQALGATLWTQDVDYEGLKGVSYLAKGN